MQSGGLTNLLVVYIAHHLVYLCRHHPITGAYHRSLINNAQNEDVYTTQAEMSMSIVPMQQVWPERSQRQAANNVSQPCQWPPHQIHRVSRGTSPQTSDQNRLPGARLCSHHHQSQRGGPPSWQQDTQQQEDGLPWHSRERHCVLPALNNRNRLTTHHHLCTHACGMKQDIEDSIGMGGTVARCSNEILRLCFATEHRYTLNSVKWDTTCYQEPYNFNVQSTQA